MFFIAELVGKVIQAGLNGFTFTIGSMAAKELAKERGWFVRGAEEEKKQSAIQQTEGA